MSRRDEIVAAARTIAMTEGVDAISVRRVAAAAGIGASTLRYYFPTSKDLVSALAGDSLDDYLTSEGLDDTSIAPAERLSRLLMQFLPASDEGLGQLETILTVHQVAFDSGKLVGSEVLRTSATRGEEIVAGWLSALQAEGAPLALSPEEGARLLLAVLNGLVLDLIAHAPKSNLEGARTTVEQAVRLVLHEA